jgi:hypothetical protein
LFSEPPIKYPPSFCDFKLSFKKAQEAKGQNEKKLPDVTENAQSGYP